jgi:hypothetical protein
MRRSTDRILTTHVGSLPRPASLLDLMKSGERGHGLDGAVTRAVDAAVRQQIAHGADVVTDGEQGKASFGYLTERLTGFEPRPGARAELWSAEVRAFREYHAEYCRRAMTGGSVVALEPLVCVGPATYRGHAAIARDIANLTAWNPSSTWCAGPPNGSVLIREGFHTRTRAGTEAPAAVACVRCRTRIQRLRAERRSSPGFTPAGNSPYMKRREAGHYPGSTGPCSAGMAQGRR